VYLDYYGLTEPPFDITPNPRFLFYSEKHREAFNHLLYGIKERKGFVQLTGEVGAGKTTLFDVLEKLVCNPEREDSITAAMGSRAALMRHLRRRSCSMRPTTWA